MDWQRDQQDGAASADGNRPSAVGHLTVQVPVERIDVVRARDGVAIVMRSDTGEAVAWVHVESVDVLERMVHQASAHLEDIQRARTDDQEGA